MESVVCTSSYLLRVRHKIPHCSRWEQLEFHYTFDSPGAITRLFYSTYAFVQVIAESSNT